METTDSSNIKGFYLFHIETLLPSFENLLFMIPGLDTAGSTVCATNVSTYGYFFHPRICFASF